MQQRNNDIDAAANVRPPRDVFRENVGAADHRLDRRTGCLALPALAHHGADAAAAAGKRAYDMMADEAGRTGDENARSGSHLRARSLSDAPKPRAKADDRIGYRRM